MRGCPQWTCRSTLHASTTTSFSLDLKGEECGGEWWARGNQSREWWARGEGSRRGSMEDWWLAQHHSLPLPLFLFKARKQKWQLTAHWRRGAIFSASPPGSKRSWARPDKHHLVCTLKEQNVRSLPQEATTLQSTQGRQEQKGTYNCFTSTPTSALQTPNAVFTNTKHTYPS